MMEFMAAKALAESELTGLACTKSLSKLTVTPWYRFMHKYFTLAAEPDDVAENARNCLRAVSDATDHTSLIQAIARASWQGSDAKAAGMRILQAFTDPTRPIMPIGDAENTFKALKVLALTLTNADLPAFADNLNAEEWRVCAKNLADMKLGM